MNAIDDCFAVGKTRMTYSEALGKLAAGLGRVAEPEPVAIRYARGRILAADLVAKRDQPPKNNAAVDGFAVFHDDLTDGAETRLPVTGRIAAGHPLGRAAKRGEALRIFTGAQVPDGLDTIFMIEDCGDEGDQAVLPPGIKRGANLRLAGEDVKAGEVALRQGTRLRAQEIAMAAALGYDEIGVFRRIKVAIFSTGDEIREPGADLDDGCIFDANRYALMAMLDDLGTEVSDLGILPDTKEAVEHAMVAAAAEHDLLLTSGGVSMGEEDHVRATVERLGTLHFWNIAVKPGRPVALGHLPADGRQVPFVGLPGNPVAALVTFMRIARPAIILLSGGSDIEPKLFQVPALFDLKKKTGRREWLRGRLIRGADGRFAADKYPEEGSGILSSMVQADGLIEIPEEQDKVTAGDLVDFLPFSEVAS